MLFTEQDLNANNAWTILENATYLSEDESIVNPQTIPVKEVSRLGYGVVRFDDVEKLSEDYGCDYIDAMYAIAEASDMNPEYLAVSVPEEDIIAYPEIVNELANIVIQPLSEYDFGYRYVDMCLEAWDNTGDEGYLEAIVDDSCLYEAAEILMEDNFDDAKAAFESQDKETQKKNTLDSNGILNNATGKKYSPFRPMANLYADAKSSMSNAEGFTGKAKALGGAMWRNKLGTASAAGVAGAGAYGVYRFAKWVKEARNKPKSWIGKKVAALRSIYQKWMQQAQKNPKKAGIIQSAAAKILSIIDALLAQLQRAAG